MCDVARLVLLEKNGLFLLFWTAPLFSGCSSFTGWFTFHPPSDRARRTRNVRILRPTQART
jgi:hypothetical protein